MNDLAGESTGMMNGEVAPMTGVNEVSCSCALLRHSELSAAGPG
jgi:hypothetical protein